MTYLDTLPADRHLRPSADVLVHPQGASNRREAATSNARPCRPTPPEHGPAGPPACRHGRAHQPNMIAAIGTNGCQALRMLTQALARYDRSFAIDLLLPLDDLPGILAAEALDADT